MCFILGSKDSLKNEHSTHSLQKNILGVYTEWHVNEVFEIWLHEFPLGALRYLKVC